MDTKFIKELISLVEASDIKEIEIEENGSRIRIEKSKITAYSKNRGAVQNSAVHKIKTNEQENDPGLCETEMVIPSGEPVISPMLGVFYAAPSPQNEPFVKIGDKVKKGDTLCIIEAMKLMNEISADRDGEIVEILATNGQIVEFEQVIFRIA